jgi:drug/metabolite transporter (DMT)-like permease
VIFSLLAAFLFACSGVCAQRSAGLLGPIKANSLRLAVATLILAVWSAFTSQIDFTSEAAFRLYISGLAGFAIGDMALFFALPRLGARLTLLINLCTAPLFGMLGDAGLMGTLIQARLLLPCLITIAGVCMALLGRSTTRASLQGSRVVGACAALIAGAGQGSGASLSRWAQRAEMAAGISLPSHVETLLRVLPASLVVAAFWLWARSTQRHQPWATERPTTSRAIQWVTTNALCGAILGVTCFQYALISQPSAVVLSITATTPILVMPMTALTEGDKPSAKSLIGAAIAVLGVVWLQALK